MASLPSPSRKLVITNTGLAWLVPPGPRTRAKQPWPKPDFGARHGTAGISPTKGTKLREKKTGERIHCKLGSAELAGVVGIVSAEKCTCTCTSVDHGADAAARPSRLDGAGAKQDVRLRCNSFSDCRGLGVGKNSMFEVFKIRSRAVAAKDPSTTRTLSPNSLHPAAGFSLKLPDSSCNRRKIGPPTAQNLKRFNPTYPKSTLHNKPRSLSPNN